MAREPVAHELRRSDQQLLHLAHCFAQADENGTADDGMANMQFANAGQPGNRLYVVVIERVPGIEAHAEVANALAGNADLVEFRHHRRRFGIAPAGVESIGMGRYGFHRRWHLCALRRQSVAVRHR